MAAEEADESHPSKAKGEEDEDGDDGDRLSPVVRRPLPGMGRSCKDRRLEEESVPSDEREISDYEDFEKVGCDQSLVVEVIGDAAQTAKLGMENGHLEGTDNGANIDVGIDEEEFRGVEEGNEQLGFDDGRSEEECGVIVLKIEEDNVHLGLKEGVDVGDRTLEVEARDNGDSFDGGNGSIELILAKQQDEDQKCLGDSGADEDILHLGSTQILEVKATEQVRWRANKALLIELEGDCGGCSTSEKAGVAKDINEVASDQMLKREFTDNVVSVDSGSGYGELSSERKDAEKEDQKLLVEPLKQVKEHDEISGLSLSKTSRGGEIDQVKNGCEDVSTLVSCELAADLPLEKVNRAGEANSTEERSEKLFEKVTCGQCNGAEVCSNEGNRKEDKLSLTTGQSMPLEYVGSQKEHCKDNSCSEDTKSSPLIVFRRSNPKRGATLRTNLAEGNFNQLSRTRNNRRNDRKAVDISSSFFLSAIKISNKFKRKRSSFRRPACPSVWGPLENLAKIFKQNGELANYDADKVCIQSKRSKKGRSTVDRKRRMESLKDGNDPVSSDDNNASSDQIMSHIVLGLQSPEYQTDFGNFSKAEASQKLTGDISDVAVKSHGQLGDKDIESSLTQEASAELGECPGVSSHIGREIQVEPVSDTNSLDPGTSPDSIVYHPGIDVGTMTSEGASSADQVIGTIDVSLIANEGATSTSQVTGSSQSLLASKPVSEDGHHSVVSASSFEALVTPLGSQPLDDLCGGFGKGKINGEVDGQPCSLQEETLKKIRKPSRSKQKKQDASHKNSRLSSKFIKKTTRREPICKNFTVEGSVDNHAELEDLKDSRVLPNGLEGVSNLQSATPILTDKTKGHKLPKNAKSGRKRENARKKMGKKSLKSDNKCRTKFGIQRVNASLDASDQMRLSSGTVYPTMPMQTLQNCRSFSGSTAVPEDVSSMGILFVGDQQTPNESNHSLEQFLPAQVAWVLCDDCEKWRCISVELANALEETKSKWTCKDNTDKAFADCSIPQEKTNSEINAELGIPDEDDPSSVKPNSNGVEPSQLAASQRASWIPIKSNVFLHRNRKTQTIDEIMVCHCKPSRDGHMGCRDQCLNRMLNIECVRGTCPCGDFCSNQQFQKRKYAKFKWFRCGKKGYGLQLQQNVSQGQFLIEYVGEVLDLAAYEARQRYYASRGQKHFYFMTLNGGEVIDACVKGNLGRFINHSCDPNCRTEKWMVNGEVCIGLFAIRDIKKVLISLVQHGWHSASLYRMRDTISIGEEVTFDYNYVRVVGAAAKKCVCGSSECRGYIGGDPLNSEIIVQSDSEEEDIEPVMVRKNSERELNATKVVKHDEVCLAREEPIVTLPHAILEPEANPLAISEQALDPMQSENTISKPLSGIQPLEYSNQSLNCVQDGENICKQISEALPVEISLQASTTLNEVVSDSILDSKKSTTDTAEEKGKTSKSNSLIKSSRSHSNIKKGRSSVKNMVSHRPRALPSGTASGRFEGVEEKLNELLDRDGGISKQKDATRGYLKLLFVTAAEGDVGGCTSQSSRDLSLILDAILKTKSRKVLMDIINKNGLQMLHNILKQNRGNFNRIPIIRKLLKVLEFLALTGILTIEQINKDPPCSGMESFKESILKLANHTDKQVHKIAREFRDKWILRTIRSVEPSDRREGGHSDRQHSYRPWIQASKLNCRQIQASRDTDAIVISTADHPPPSCELNISGETSHSHQLSISPPATNTSSASMTKTRKRKTRWDNPSDIILFIEDRTVETSLKYIKPTSTPSEQTSQLEDSKLICGPQIELDDEGPPGFGLTQKANNFQVSSEIGGDSGEVVMGQPQDMYLSHLNISYGIPVALMQQLGTPEYVGSNRNSNSKWGVAPGMPFQPFPPLPSYPRGRPNLKEQREELSIPSTSGGGLADNSQFNGRVRIPNNGRGRKFFHPQRFNNRRFGRCRPYQRFGHGFRGGSVRNGPVRRDVGGGFGPRVGVNYNDVSSNFHQQHN